jgi:hypothetical protein
MGKGRNTNKQAVSRRRGTRRGNKNVIRFTRELIVTRGKVAADTGTYLGFSFSQFLASDIQAMFTEYRITKLELTWMLVNAPNNNANFPTLYNAAQHVFISPSAPASRDEVIQFQGIKHHQFGPSNLVYTRAFEPWVPIDANSVGKEFVRSPWLSTASDIVPHYVAVDWLSRYNSAVDSSHTIELVVRATIETRGVR